MDKNDIKRFKWKKFKLIAPLGKGSFGEIWMGILRKEKRRVAIKFERRKKNQKHFWLKRESDILRTLQSRGVNRITQQIWFGVENGFNVMMMNVIGDSLLDIKSIYKKFHLKIVLMIGIQLLDIVEAIHKCGIIHCDVKPSNLLFNQRDQRFELIDFGLAKRYIVPKESGEKKKKKKRKSKSKDKHSGEEIFDTNDGVHYEYKSKKKGNNSITGTALFCSIGTHLGNLSRRDDLESIGMVMVYLLHGRLPWQGIRGETKYDKYFKIYKKKVMTLSTFFKGLEPEFREYFRYVRKLEFKEDPDYEYLRNLWHYLMIKKKYYKEGNAKNMVFDFGYGNEEFMRRKRERRELLERSKKVMKKAEPIFHGISDDHPPQFPIPLPPAKQKGGKKKMKSKLKFYSPDEEPDSLEPHEFPEDRSETVSEEKKKSSKKSNGIDRTPVYYVKEEVSFWSWFFS